MKEIKKTKRFYSHFKIRIAPDRKLVKAFHQSVEAFLEDPTLVDDHQLEGKMALYRAFLITDDYRVVFTETPDYFIFQDIGTHEEVYYR
jgi:mRNA-degrading endonuclease YafQ of YafQ-DinJ toxin-antitoxin module